MKRLLGLLLLLEMSCKSGALRDGRFLKEGVSYQVTAPGAGWKSIGFAENDLAWAAADSGDVVAMNATCSNHGDPSLEVLTNHLLFGFTERNKVSAELEKVDGREALRSVYTALLDGVPVDLEVLVLKKNDCVHDFTHVAPRGTLAKNHAVFEQLITGFHQERTP